MNRIVKAHLDSFASKFGFENDAEDVQFEKFCNYSILTPKIGSSFDIEDVTTGKGDDGCDGITILIDEEVVSSQEDAVIIFSSPKRNHDVDLVFIQSKRSDSFDLGDFLKFKESVLRFIDDKSDSSPDDELQSSYKKVLEVVLKNITKLRNGKPSIIARYACTGSYKQPKALEDARNSFKNQLVDLSLFESIDIQFIDRDELTRLWVSTYSGTKASLEMFSHAALPSISGIEEAYLAIVNAKAFVSNLLVSGDGSLNTQVFEENVRSFLGSENPINNSMSNTIKSIDSASRFPVLNNGITVVSPDVKIQGNILYLENYQIVNGCQTSSVLFENKGHLTEKIMIALKIVETSSEDVFSELVRSTNSQTKVEESQFLSLKPLVKRVEQYFNSFQGPDGTRIYLERRDRQYIGKDIPIIRIFSLHYATKCVASMFCHRPDLASAYNKLMYQSLQGEIFKKNNKEIIFLAACITLYRFNLLVSNGYIPQNTKQYKWHIIALVGAMIAGRSVPDLKSPKVEGYSEKIISVMSSHNETATSYFKRAIEIVNSVEISKTRLKSQALFLEMIDLI